jgi:mono/diheme cytochrome c family protein
MNAPSHASWGRRPKRRLAARAGGGADKRRLAALVCVAAGAALAGGCGGSTPREHPEAARSVAMTPQAKRATAKAAARRGTESGMEFGRRVFKANCGLCHTLADAGTKGEIGPNLDKLKPDVETVRLQVTRTLAMPREQIDAVARYIASVAGKK